MKHDQLDDLLSREDSLEPSSGFAARVMASVTAQAAAPPPLAYPWRRLVPGLAALALVLVLLAWAALASPSGGSLTFDFSAPVWRIAAWTGLGLVVSFLALAFSFHLASRAS